jgi:tetratricopeptide (TPR) repeat protein
VVRAEELAKKALKIQPSSAIFWRVLGAALYRQGLWTAAVEALDKAIELDADDRCAAIFQAMAHWRLGKKDQAHSWLEKSARIAEAQLTTDRLVRRLQADAVALITVQSPQAKVKLKPFRQ